MADRPEIDTRVHRRTRCTTTCVGGETGPLPPHRPTPSPAAVAQDATAWGHRTWCSWHDSGWRSLLVRDLVSTPRAVDVLVPTVDDEVLVLVTHGGKRIESGSNGRTRSAVYGPGTIALTAPGREGRFSWRTEGDEPQRAIHVHLPGSCRTRCRSRCGTASPG